jgi:hypothetical protein
MRREEIKGKGEKKRKDGERREVKRKVSGERAFSFSCPKKRSAILRGRFLLWDPTEDPLHSL